MDDLSGRNTQLRKQSAEAELECYGDVLANTCAYLKRPQYPFTKQGKRHKRPQIETNSHEVQELRQHPSLERATITLRPHQGGVLQVDFARRWIWTIYRGQPHQECLLIRQDGPHVTYSFSNTPADTSLSTMAQRKSQRCFIERSNQDAKSELSWDEFRTTRVSNLGTSTRLDHPGQLVYHRHPVGLANQVRT